MVDAISCNALTKDYGSGHGLFDASLKIPQGEIFGLIGPNGAGKSTLIKILMDLVRPTSGSAEIFGLDSRSKSTEIKARVGYLPGELVQFPRVTSGYLLNLLLNMRGVKSNAKMLELSERLKLDLNKRYQNLSHGNKQKVGLIQAFMHDPELLILDEPTLGLDPMIQKELRAMIMEYKDQGKTVILSSHVLSEIETVCSKVALIHRGRIVRQGTLQDLRGARVHKLSVRLAQPADSLQSLKTRLAGLGVREIESENNRLNFDVAGEIDEVLKELSRYQVAELDSRELSLEEVFFSEVESDS